MVLALILRTTEVAHGFRREARPLTERKIMLDRIATIAKLKKYRSTVRPEFEDDEGCFEHLSEIDGAILAVEKLDEGKAVAEVNGLGLGRYLVMEVIVCDCCGRKLTDKLKPAQVDSILDGFKAGEMNCGDLTRDAAERLAEFLESVGFTCKIDVDSPANGSGDYCGNKNHCIVKRA